MAVTWVLEHEAFDASYIDDFINHFNDKNIKYERIYVSSFEAKIEENVPIITTPCVAYGSIGIDAVAQKYGWKPGAFSNPVGFRTESYANALGDLFLNDKMKILPLKEVQNILLEENMTECFMKPDDDNKAFAGKVFNVKDINTWIAHMIDIGYFNTDEIKVAVSGLKNISREWRFVVVDGEICAESLYLSKNERKIESGSNSKARTLVLQAHSIFSPAPIYVIDIAETDKGYRVIEYNTFNSAEMYGGDISRIVDAVTNYVERVSGGER